MPKLEGVDLEDLDASFGGFKSGDATPNKSASDKAKIEGVDFGDLDAAFGVASAATRGRVDNGRIYVSPAGTETPKPTRNADAPGPVGQGIRDFASGVWQGVKDVPTTVAHGIGYVDEAVGNLADTSSNPTVRTLFGGGAARNERFKQADASEKAALPVDNSAFDWGRMGGQIVATAPLAAATPEYAAVKALPYVGKLGASVLRGATGGAVFGAATNSANDQGLISNVGENAAYGAVGGPLAEGALKYGKKALGAVAEKLAVANIVRNTGIDPGAARNTLARLTDAGFTPDQAKNELLKLGKAATLGDIDPALTAEVSGLAAMGGKPTSILKNRFGERAQGANSAAHDIMETKLGAKPDYEAEKAAAKLERQQKTSADYEAAKASKMALDVTPVAQGIAAKLETAVGSEAKELETINSYLFNKDGNIKADTAPLLKVRQAIDDRLTKLKSEGTSQATATYRAVSNVRDELDKVLKTNPDLAAADAKYAKLRQDFEGLDLGKSAVSPKSNFDNFAREFDAASPEKQEYMRKGLRIQIGDLMEKATRGELSEAQRLFGKSTANRNIIEKAFGQEGTDVLNALEKEAKFRGTEQAVRANSLTAERRAIQERPEYGGHNKPGLFAGAGPALIADVATGTPGAGTAINAGRNILSKLTDKFSEAKIKRTIEGTADLLSRKQSNGGSDALDVLNRIHGKNSSRLRLPVEYNGLDAITQRSSLPVVIEGIRGARKKFLER